MSRCLWSSILVIILSSGFMAPAQAEDMLGFFAGKWKGSGLVRQQQFGVQQKIKCKIKGKLHQSGSAIFAGRCATAGKAGAFSFEVIRGEGEGQYQAVASYSGVEQPIGYKGVELTEDSAQSVPTDSPVTRNLIFTINRPYLRDGRKIHSLIAISFKDQNHMEIREMVTDLYTNEISDALTLQFARP